MTSTPDDAVVGNIVHLLHGGVCQAAIITEVSDKGIGLHVFGAPQEDWDNLATGMTAGWRDGYHPYNSLSSARPTSGWHWLSEHSK